MIQRVIRFAEYMDVYVVHNFLDMNTLVNVVFPTHEYVTVNVSSESI